MLTLYSQFWDKTIKDITSLKGVTLKCILSYNARCTAYLVYIDFRTKTLSVCVFVCRKCWRFPRTGPQCFSVLEHLQVGPGWNGQVTNDCCGLASWQNGTTYIKCTNNIFNKQRVPLCGNWERKKLISEYWMQHWTVSTKNCFAWTWIKFS